MIRKILIIILSILIILTIAFIFHNSSESSAVSNYKSEAVTEIVKPAVENVTSSQNVITQLNEYVRKAAHVIEFIFLGAEMYSLFIIVFGKSFGMFSFVPLFGTLATGVTDEFIQSFTGRTSYVKDVLIDFSGAMCGMLFVVLIYLFIKLIKKSRNRYQVKSRV